MTLTVKHTPVSPFDELKMGRLTTLEDEDLNEVTLLGTKLERSRDHGLPASHRCSAPLPPLE